LRINGFFEKTESFSSLSDFERKCLGLLSQNFNGVVQNTFYVSIIGFWKTKHFSKK